MMPGFTLHLLSPVDIGHTFVISGLMEKDWKHFKIVFLLYEDDGSEIALMIQADRKTVTLSSRINHETVSTEIIESDILAENSTFKFSLLTFDDKFSIALNDTHLCYYKFECELSKIKVVRVLGDVTKVNQFDHRSVFPVVCPLLQSDTPKVSFSCDVPTQFCENTVIVIRASLKGNKETGRFFIRFNEQGTTKQLFHFNPRFDEKSIIVNSMNDNLEWQSEERSHQGSHNFPFNINKEFQLALLLDEDRFRVSKDGNHLIDYPYRTVKSTQLRVSKSHPIFEKLTGFKIIGLNDLDVIVSYVDFFKIKQNDSKFYEMFSNMNFI